MLHKNFSSDCQTETNTSNANEMTIPNVMTIQNPLTSTKFIFLQMQIDILAKQRKEFRLPPGIVMNNRFKKIINKEIEENNKRLSDRFRIPDEVAPPSSNKTEPESVPTTLKR